MLCTGHIDIENHVKIPLADVLFEMCIKTPVSISLLKYLNFANLYIYIYVCVYIYIYVCVCVYIYVCVCVCIVCALAECTFLEIGVKMVQ